MYNSYMKNYDQSITDNSIFTSPIILQVTLPNCTETPTSLTPLKTAIIADVKKLKNTVSNGSSADLRNSPEDYQKCSTCVQK